MGDPDPTGTDRDLAGRHPSDAEVVQRGADPDHIGDRIQRPDLMEVHTGSGDPMNVGLRGSESLGSPGIENLRWLKPVRPGDTLTAHFTVLEARPSETRPDRGIVRSRGEMLNQRIDVVMQLEAVNFFARRPG